MCTFRQALREIIEDDVQDIISLEKDIIKETYNYIKDYFDINTNDIKISENNSILIQLFYDKNKIEEIEEKMNCCGFYLIRTTPTFENSVILQFVTNIYE